MRGTVVVNAYNPFEAIASLRSETLFFYLQIRSVVLPIEEEHLSCGDWRMKHAC